MQVWHKIKSIGRKLGTAAGKLYRRVKLEIEDAIPSRKLRWMLLAVITALTLLAAYLIALIQVGVWNNTTSVMGLLELYILDGYDFPFLFFILIVCLMVGVVFWLFKTGADDGDRNFTYSDSDVYGSAGEISLEELQKVGEVKPIEELAGMILGQLDTTGTKVIGMNPNPVSNRNVVVFASPGQGKSFAVVKPQIVQALRRGESVVCTDTKGELRADTIELARRYGYTIRNINLKYLKYSDGWHVLKELRFDDERALVFAQIVMRNSGNPKDPHIALEEALLKACCLYVERNPLIPPNEKNFYQVYSMIIQGPAKLDEIFEAAKFDRDLRVACDAYAPFTGSEPLRTNVIANLTSRIQILASPVVQQLTSTDDVDLTLPGRKKCIYYVTMSDQHETMKFLASLFFTFLFLDLGDYADAQVDRRLPVPVNVILEEAANVGEIVGLTNYLSSARSRAIAITLIFQGLTQIVKTYGTEDTGTILNDCYVHACLGTMEQSTAEHFEWLSGIATVKVKTEQHDAYESPLTANYRHSTGDGRRSVFTSNEVRKTKQGSIIIAWLGYDTIRCHTFGINQHPEHKKGHMPAIPLADTEARAYLRAKEEQRVIEYEEWENDGGYAWEGYDFPPPKCDGPSRSKPKPAVIPYPELEQMALAYSNQVRSGAASNFNFAAMEQDRKQDTTQTDQPPLQAPENCEPRKLDEAGPAEEQVQNAVAPSTHSSDDTADQSLPEAKEQQPEKKAEMPAPVQLPDPVPADAVTTIPEAPEVPASVVPAPAVKRDKKTAPKPTQPKRSGSGTLYATKTIKRDSK